MTIVIIKEYYRKRGIWHAAKVGFCNDEFNLARTRFVDVCQAFYMPHYYTTQHNNRVRIVNDRPGRRRRQTGAAAPAAAREEKNTRQRHRPFLNSCHEV